MSDALALAHDTSRSKAVRRAAAVARAQALLAEGRSRFQAETMAAEEHGVSRGSVMRWLAKAGASAPGGEVQALLDRHPRGDGRPSVAWDTPGAEEAWRIWSADYLRPERPGAMACWRRVARIARSRGWTIPCERTFRRRLIETVRPEEIVRLRDGAIAALALYPAQTRTVAGMAPLDCVSGDGRQHDVFVALPDGRIIRPVGWYWQDVRTRKVLGWYLGETENQDIVRLAFMRMCDDYGVPRSIVVDNTRAASATALSNQNRRGWKSDGENVWGVFQALSVGVTRTHMEREDDGRNYGWGQGKPVERAFLDLAETIDKHPACAGAYTGRSTMAKPANYQTRAVDWDVFRAVVADEVAQHNARPGRRTEAAAGRSFDAIWTEEVVSTPVRRLTAEQRALLLLAPEPVRVKPDGTFTLAAGRGVGLPANRYQHDSLRALIHRRADRRTVVARFDPDDLHAGVHVFDHQGKWCCFAECIAPVGFNNLLGAREHARARGAYRRSLRQAAKARERIEDVLEEYGVRPTAPEPAPAPGVTELVIPGRASAPTTPDTDLAREDTLTRFAREGLRAVNEH